MEISSMQQVPHRLLFVLRQSGAFFFLFCGSQSALDPSCADVILLTAIMPEIAEIAVEFHRIRFYPHLNPANAGMDILQPEMLAAETCFLFLLHTYLVARIAG